MGIVDGIADGDSQIQQDLKRDHEVLRSRLCPGGVGGRESGE